MNFGAGVHRVEKRLDQMAIARRLVSPRDPRLRNLVRRRPGRVWAEVGRCYGLMLLALVLLAAVDCWWIPILSFLLIGTQQYAIFILGHDGMHANLVRRRSANDAFTTALLYAPLGMYLNDQRANHLSHHWLLGTDADPDRYLHAAGNKATRGKFLFFLTGLMTFARTLIKVSPFGKRRDPQGSQLWKFLVSRWPGMLAQVVLFAAMALFFPWWSYFVFWLMPIYFLVFVPDEIRAFCEHAQALLPDSAGDPGRLITFVPNVLERTFLAPMNMNFHAEHHLWPFVPYYNLPELHRLIANSREIEIRRSYVGFLWS